MIQITSQISNTSSLYRTHYHFNHYTTCNQAFILAHTFFDLPHLTRLDHFPRAVRVRKTILLCSKSFFIHLTSKSVWKEIQFFKLPLRSRSLCNPRNILILLTMPKTNSKLKCLDINSIFLL